MEKVKQFSCYMHSDIFHCLIKEIWSLLYKTRTDNLNEMLRIISPVTLMSDLLNNERLNKMVKKSISWRSFTGQTHSHPEGQRSEVKAGHTGQDQDRPHASGWPKNPLFTYSVNTIFQLQIRFLMKMWAFSFLFQPHGMILYMKTNHHCSEDAAPSLNYSRLCAVLASSGR